MLDTTTTAVPSIAPGEVLDIHAWALHVTAPPGWPGGAVRRRPRALRACIAVDRATNLALGAVASGDPTEDLAPTALRMALSDKSRHARAAGARSDWDERALPLVVTVDADATTIRRWRFPRLAHALRIALVVDPRIRFVGERGLARAIPAEAMTPAGGSVDAPSSDNAACPTPAEAVAARVQAALVRHLVDHHNRTRSRVLGGRTPAQAWREALGTDLVKLPTTEDMRAFGLEGTSRRIEPGGIRVFGTWYQAPVLQALRAAGEREAELRVEPTDPDRVDVRFGGAWHPVRRAAPACHDRTSAGRSPADLGWTHGAAAETGTLHLRHEDAWRRADGDAAASHGTWE